MSDDCDHESVVVDKEYRCKDCEATIGSESVAAVNVFAIHRLIEEWRDKGDMLIHEGENEYVEGRGGQLAQCARELEQVLEE